MCGQVATDVSCLVLSFTQTIEVSNNFSTYKSLIQDARQINNNGCFTFYITKIKNYTLPHSFKTIVFIGNIIGTTPIYTYYLPAIDYYILHMNVAINSQLLKCTLLQKTVV